MIWPTINPLAVKTALRRMVLIFFVLPLLLAAAYLYVVYTYDYSQGERAGYLQRFSEKGWICKTYEGEIAMTTVPGVAPVIWNFSVRDQEVANQMRGLLGKKVIVHYREYRYIESPYLPTRCMGETGYFVDRVSLGD